MKPSPMPQPQINIYLYTILSLYYEAFSNASTTNQHLSTYSPVLNLGNFRPYPITSLSINSIVTTLEGEVKHYSQIHCYLSTVLSGC